MQDHIFCLLYYLCTWVGPGFYIRRGTEGCNYTLLLFFLSTLLIFISISHKKDYLQNITLQVTYATYN